MKPYSNKLFAPRIVTWSYKCLKSIIFILLFWEFFTPALADDFLGLSDNKSPQVSRTRLSILVDFNNAVVWMVSTCPLVSKFFSPYINSFGDSTERANYNWYHRHFHVP